MANGIKLEHCPDCGAALAANLAKLLRTDPLNYSCPGGSTNRQSRKEFEKAWGEDLTKENV